jgi:hypothetical protein
MLTSGARQKVREGESPLNGVLGKITKESFVESYKGA